MRLRQHKQPGILAIQYITIHLQDNDLSIVNIYVLVVDLEMQGEQARLHACIGVIM